MRLLQLMTRPGEVLDLHPRVSVVQGLRPEDRHLLIQTVRSLVQPDTGHVATGLLEAHGVLFDLRPELVAMLDVAGDDLEPVVRAGDLPTQPLTVDARELRAKQRAFEAIIAAVAEKAELETAARARVEETSATLSRVRAERSAAEAGISDRLARLDGVAADLDRRQADEAQAREELARATAAAAETGAALAEVDARTSEDRGAVKSAQAALTAAREALATAQAAADVDAPAAVEAAIARQDEVSRRLSEARERTTVDEARPVGVSDGATAHPAAEVEPSEVAAALEQELLALDVGPRDEVERALAQLDRHDDQDGPSAEAHDLAAEIEDLLADPADTEEAELDPGRVDAARTGLDRARQALMIAEEAVRSPHRDAEGVARIEQAHDALLAALDKVDGRFGGGRARARVDQLREAEQDALGALGFHSYTDFIMGNSSLTAGDADHSALTAARAELAAAEHEWSEVERLTEAALAQAVVRDRRRELTRRAEALLGTSVARLADAPSRLRELRVAPVGVSVALDELRSALADVGFDLEDDTLDRDDVTALAASWLAEADAVAARRDQIGQRLAALRAGEPDPGPEAAPSIPDSEVSEDDAAAAEVTRLEAALVAADEELTAARARLAAHGVAEEERQRLASEVTAAEELVASAEAAAWSAEQEYRAARDEDQRAQEQQQAAQQKLAEAEAALTSGQQQLTDLEEQSRVGLDQFSAAVAEAEADHIEARSALEHASHELATLNAEGQALATAIERLQDIVAAGDVGEATPAEELEWYLLARLASQRAVSLGGSLPVVLDDALTGLDADDVSHILERLEPMAEALQVIVLSDDPTVSQWAVAAGPTRAAVVHPGPA